MYNTRSDATRTIEKEGRSFGSNAQHPLSIKASPWPYCSEMTRYCAWGRAVPSTSTHPLSLMLLILVASLLDSAVQEEQWWHDLKAWVEGTIVRQHSDREPVSQVCGRMYAHVTSMWSSTACGRSTHKTHVLQACVPSTACGTSTHKTHVLQACVTRTACGTCCSFRQLVNQEPFSFPVSVISLSVNNPDITTSRANQHTLCIVCNIQYVELRLSCRPVWCSLNTRTL